jgi:hypothetical protein
MSCEHQISLWESSLFKMAEESKKVVGFDGPFSLPDELRVWLDVAHAGEKLMFVRIVNRLQLSKENAKALYFSLISEPQPDSVEEVDKFIEYIRSR